MRFAFLLGSMLLAGLSHAAQAGGSIKVPLNVVDEKGVVAAAGEVIVTESSYGLVFSPALTGLPAGVHGFHLHENPSCDPVVKDGKPVAALAAGGHWDPAKSGHHGGPYEDGHKGDLPAVYAGTDGKVSYPVLAPRLHSLDEIRGHALMVHVGADNHDDHPLPLGGGGVRLVCGVIR
jgi:superoxide dismutase, Cu-Zn family